MGENEPVTLLKYYKSFRSISGVIAAVLSTLPLLSILPPNALTAYVFPPVGDLEGPARMGVVLLAASSTYFAFFTGEAPNDSNRRRIVAAFIIFFICFLAYLAFWFSFVQTIEISTKGTKVQVSVGYERSPFAIRYFDSDSDGELLRARGPEEEEIQKLWTAKSLLVSRLSLIITYYLFISVLVCAFRWGVLEQCNRKA
jgi:hypothetical protein